MKHLVVFWCSLLLGLSGLAASRPNFVWIVSEDMSPTLGCYGDRAAITPRLDRLAGEGARFTRAFSHAPVCAPSRSGLITGQYPIAIGTHHMRSELLAPPTTFTALLRKAGYHVAWPGKTDFNFKPPADAFDTTAPWLDQAPPQPFFAYINFNASHESKIRLEARARKKNLAALKPSDYHDPQRMKLPPYYPDTPVVRRDMANYYDNVTAVDYSVGAVLDALDRMGLATNTVVFYFGDHGAGLPRSKRWLYDSGTRVPFLVRWPGHLAPGSVREDLVSFTDFAPTLLALAGIKPPASMPGRVFLGDAAQPERKYVYAARDRMDETYDRIRAVRDRRFRYIRNYHPELPYAQPIAYMDEMPTMQVWRRLAAENKLEGPAKLFFAPTKPAEELYDCEADPWEIQNLAGRPEHRAKLQELRAALDQWVKDAGDLGAIPEQELVRRGLVADRLSTYKTRKSSVQP